MTTVSKSLDVQFRGKPAELVIMRNDGFCWGRIDSPMGQFDVIPQNDLYDETDDTALECMARIVSTSEGGFVEESFFD